MTTIQSIARIATEATAAQLLTQITKPYFALPKEVRGKGVKALREAVQLNPALAAPAAEAAAYHRVKRLAEGGKFAAGLAAAWYDFMQEQPKAAPAIEMVAAPLKKPKASKVAGQPKVAPNNAKLIAAMKAQGLSADVILAVLAGA